MYLPKHASPRCGVGQSHSLYNNHAHAKRSLRRLRYSQGRRQEFRLRVWSIEHDGAIQCTVPSSPGVTKIDLGKVDPANPPE